MQHTARDDVHDHMRIALARPSNRQSRHPGGYLIFFVKTTTARGAQAWIKLISLSYVGGYADYIELFAALCYAVLPRSLFSLFSCIRSSHGRLQHDG